jgi:hypothetical protein
VETKPYLDEIRTPTAQPVAHRCATVRRPHNNKLRHEAAREVTRTNTKHETSENVCVSMAINLDIDVWNKRTCIAANGHRTGLGASLRVTYGLMPTTPLHTAFTFKSRGAVMLQTAVCTLSSRTNIHTDVSVTWPSAGGHDNVPSDIKSDEHYRRNIAQLKILKSGERIYIN